MRTFSVIELGLAVTIIALAGISVVTSLLTAQSASATDVTMNNTTVGGGGGGEAEAARLPIIQMLSWGTCS